MTSRLEEISIARRILLPRPDELDAEARVLQIEVKSWRNLKTPVSVLPDQVLAMVFKAGTVLERMPGLTLDLSYLMSYNAGATSRWPLPDYGPKFMLSCQKGWQLSTLR